MRIGTRAVKCCRLEHGADQYGSASVDQTGAGSGGLQRGHRLTLGGKLETIKVRQETAQSGEDKKAHLDHVEDFDGHTGAEQDGCILPSVVEQRVDLLLTVLRGQASDSHGRAEGVKVDFRRQVDDGADVDLSLLK